MKGNNAIPAIHLRKHWQRYVKTFFNQPANKRRRLMKRKEKASQTFPRPLEKLRPVVRGQSIRYNSRTKLGRGFSLQELKEAKITPIFASSIGISVDHRRQNKSQESLDLNKRRLLAYLNKLVLFPRHEGKPKKGVVNDTTNKESLEQVVQNESHKLMERTPYTFKKREKAMQITSQMKQAKVYQKMRIERVNEKLTGMRAKRAKDLAERNK